MCESPAVIAVAVVIPVTGTGAGDGVVVPLPSCPSRLSPQHLTAPPVNSAHVWPVPVAMAVTGWGTGTAVSGVTALDRADPVPVPTALIAATLNRYVVPLVKPGDRLDGGRGA